MNNNKTSVLVVDAGVRHAIDIVRSLGSKGIQVSILSKEKHPPASFSRYVDQKHTFPLDVSNMEPSIEFIEELICENGYDTVIAAGLEGFRILSFGLDRLSRYAPIPVSDWSNFAIAEDKAETTLFGERVGVPVPTTYYPNGLADLDNYKHLPFPVIVKARRGQGHFDYAGSFQELVEVTYPQICSKVEDQIAEGVYPIIQKLVKGKGHGFYALMNQGVVKAYFMHERVHEVPPSGGPSAIAKTYYDEDLIEAGTTMLCELNWHGVAMVEFKKDVDDGKYKLIEINPKFWGSLGLSIATGIDFPYLLTKMAIDDDVDSVVMPRKPVTYQWLSMDIAHSFAIGKPFQWLQYVVKGVPNDFRLADPLPNLTLITQRGADVLRGQRRLKSSGSS